MHLAVLWWLSATVSSAVAQDEAPLAAPERWEDGFSVRAPTTWAVTTQIAPVFGLDDVVFGDLRVGGPFVRSPNGAVTFGFVASLQTTSVFTRDGRSPSLVRSLGADLWLGFEGARHRSHHAVVARWRHPPRESEQGWFQLNPAETGVRLGLVYDGYADLGDVHLSLEARIGLSTATLAELGGSLVLLVPVGERLAFGAGVSAGAYAMVTPMVSARARPARGLELGASLVLPRSLDGGVTYPYPQIELKVAPGG